MVIEVEHYKKDTNELISKTIKTLHNDKDVENYLKEIDLHKMQIICDRLNLGKYKPSLILKNANSKNSIQLINRSREWSTSHYRATDKKKLYDDFVKTNEIKTVINIF